MKWTVKGKYKGKQVEMVWDNGKLSGSLKLINALRRRAALLEGTLVGPVGGPFTQRHHLQDPLSAIYLVWDLFDEDPKASGEIPYPPKVPKDAII